MASLFFLVALCGCQPSNRQLLEEAEAKQLYRKSEVARALFFRILRDHPTKDDIRFRAYSGLIETLRSQFYNYGEAAEALERLIQEFGSEPLYREAVDRHRLELAAMYLASLDRSNRALELLLECADRLPVTVGIQSQLADLFTNLSEWEKAEKYLQVAWSLAEKEKSCQSLRSLQILAIHLYQSMKRCDRSLEWAQQKLSSPCVSDHYGIAIEKAHCYEMMNEPKRAVEILEDYRRINPDNKRVDHLITELKTRERRKEQR